MHIGYIGLGKMGANMVARLLEEGHQVTVWNRSPEPVAEAVALGAQSVKRVEDFVQALVAPRVVWVMLPSGDVTKGMLETLANNLEAGDTVIDGANSMYKNTVAAGPQFVEKKIHFHDVAVSGGPSGARNGACLMIGGSVEHAKVLEPLFTSIAAPNAYAFFEGLGAGHFVKMVHNGIEYGMMQAIAEGFGVLRAAPFNLDLVSVAKLYNQQSVIESRLVGWLADGLEQQGTELPDISGTVAHSGEGQWTVETAKELNIPVPIIEGSLQFRIESQQNPSYVGKLLSLLRHQFGGHQMQAKK
jgi:6-phosphogluconate dehydrogenase